MNHSTPLAERVRPSSLDDFIGQKHLVGKSRLLRELIDQGTIPSLLLWGPPGSGKTTLATILANSLHADFIFFSAVLSGVKDIRKIVQQAQEKNPLDRKKSTILFVDEIHRFNKSQQDAFLPHVESGLLTLIGATTENPSFQVIAPLLSRCQVLLLKPLQEEDIKTILRRALLNSEQGLGELGLDIEKKALSLLAAGVDGDTRRALNGLETAAILALKQSGQKPCTISEQLVHEAMQQRTLRYDQAGEEHYNIISALHKSMRDSDPDGACYWLGRMLTGGEDPLYIARRLIRFASEDIGNADPRALEVAISCRQAYHMLGSPEGELALYQATSYLATAPKSNALYKMEKLIRKEIKKSGSLPVPLHLRNAPTRLMKDIGYGKDYQYAHDQEKALVAQEHLPEALSGHTFYHPMDRGYETIILDRLTKWRQILNQRIEKHNHADKKNSA